MTEQYSGHGKNRNGPKTYAEKINTDLKGKTTN